LDRVVGRCWNHRDRKRQYRPVFWKVFCCVGIRRRSRCTDLGDGVCGERYCTGGRGHQSKQGGSHISRGSRDTCWASLTGGSYISCRTGIGRISLCSLCSLRSRESFRTRVSCISHWSRCTCRTGITRITRRSHLSCRSCCSGHTQGSCLSCGSCSTSWSSRSCESCGSHITGISDATRWSRRTRYTRCTRIRRLSSSTLGTRRSRSSRRSRCPSRC